DKPVNLDYTHSQLAFRFISGSFRDEQNLTFRYRLDGFDESWQTLTRRPDNQEFRYNVLPAGDYRFYLQSKNSDGIWSDIAVSETITIAIPYWETWWFMVGSVLLPIMLVMSFFHNRSQKRYSDKLEREVHDRTTQLRLSEQRYKQLFDESRDVVFISTPDGWFLDMNPSGLKLFEVESLDQLRSLNIAENFYVNPPDRYKYISLLSKQGYLQDYEIKMKTLSGKQLTIIETVNAMRGRNGILQFRGIMRDVTNQRTMEKQLVLAEKMEAVGLMASGIAHDFNNLLSGILGYASLLKLSFKNGSDEHGYVETIEESAHNAAGLTEQLMGFAQQHTYRIEPLNLNSIIEDTHKLFKRIFDKSIDIQLSLDRNIALVAGDEAQMQRMIVNLGINARDAMPNGGVLLIKTGMHQLDEEETTNGGLSRGRYVSMEISDTGIGIDSSDKEHIFEPFFTTKEAGKGTGLGLAMVYSAVNSHGGVVKVESELGRGTTFRILLPGTDMPAAEKKSKPATLHTGSETILIVDDEKHVRSLLKHTLERYGYKTILAETGIEAISMLQKHAGKINLVILDMIMPRMGGAEALSKLRNLKPGIPVLIATGYPGDGNEAVDIQFEEVLRKPFKVSELLQRVRTMLDNTPHKNGSHSFS
ncbi:MAG: response regulator, partial [Calditrichota bacterium]